jgi:hypothetical protein
MNEIHSACCDATKSIWPNPQWIKTPNELHLTLEITYSQGPFVYNFDTGLKAMGKLLVAYVVKIRS